MSERPRVVLVGPWAPPPGGVGTFMTKVVESALAGRYAFLRYDISRPEKKNVYDNYGYVSMFRGGIGRLLVGGAMTIWNLARFPFFLLVRQPDIVQVHASDFVAFWEAILYVLLARLLRRPVLMRLGGSFDYFYGVSSRFAQRLIRRALRSPDRLIVQSAYWRDFVARLGRTEGIVVLPNWVPDAAAAAGAHHTADPPVCLYSAGSEAARKGVNEVFAAMGLLGARGVPVAFRLVALAPSLRERIALEAPPLRFTAEDYLSPAGMAEAMREADIFLLPSHGEGFPNALLEAMAAGLACIATPVGAVPEMLGEDGGIIIARPDPEAIAAAVARLAGDPALRRRLGERANAIVRERYVASVVLDALDEAWQALIAARRPVGSVRAVSG
jgi:glycosyltransferase involved in cell wall biosynthesis